MWITLGSGPAGLQAAIHAVRAKVSVLVLGKHHRSSLYRAHIEDFCCLSKVDGQTLLKDGQKQAEKFGARFLDEDAVEVSRGDQGFLVKSESGKSFTCRALIFALGIFRNKLNVPGVYEAGDICGPPWQVAIAVGQVAVAGLQAASYAKEHRSMVTF